MKYLWAEETFSPRHAVDLFQNSITNSLSDYFSCYRFSKDSACDSAKDSQRCGKIFIIVQNVTYKVSVVDITRSSWRYSMIPQLYILTQLGPYVCRPATPNILEKFNMVWRLCLSLPRLSADYNIILVAVTLCSHSAALVTILNLGNLFLSSFFGVYPCVTYSK